MRYSKLLLALIFLIISRTITGQTFERAEAKIKSALVDTIQLNNVVNLKVPIVKDSSLAINIAETILFDIYGKANIIKQKPYSVFHIGNYWLLEGSLPKHSVGGTFLIILDDRNARVIKITHGK